MGKYKINGIRAKKKNNLSFMLLVILLISVILCISSFGIATWARYRSVTGGNVVAQIAKWSFKVNGEEEKFATINLADTIDFTHVTIDKVAPGTYGSFNLDIDGRGSEVSLDYYISILANNKPTNLKFYSDSGYSTQIDMTIDNTMYLEGDLLLSENPMQETRTIYWKWDYRTEDLPSTSILQGYYSSIVGLEALVNEYNAGTEQQKQELTLKINDKIDTYEADGDVILEVSVKGIQINSNFALKRAQITSSKDGSYEEGDTVNFSIEFTENIYADNNQTAITNATAPEVVVGFQGVSNANAPVAKVASTLVTNINLAARKKTATFVSVDGNKLNYTYTITAIDSGYFKIESITGKVYNSDGVRYNLGTKIPEITDGNIMSNIDAVIPQIKVDSEIVLLTKENVVDYYGKLVTNYNATNSVNWRIFYVDFDGKYGARGTIYLKADKVGQMQLDVTAPENYDSALNIMKDMNPDWAENDGIVDENNEMAVIGLFDESRLSNYKDINKTNYIIGAPSVEMFLDSYNQYHSQKETAEYQQVNCKWFDLTESERSKGYMYSVGVNNENYVITTDSSVLKSDEKKMYVNSYIWLASPSANDLNSMCYSSGNSLGDSSYDWNNCSICPVVSLKSGVIPEIKVPKIVVDGQTVLLTKENAGDYYGKEVTNYDCSATATWRLFYVDFNGNYGEEECIYLKADQVTTNSLNINASASSTSALNRAREKNYNSINFNSLKNYAYGKAILWLCDENVWINYKNVAKASYVMGAPSAYMYAESYNQYHSKKRTEGYKKVNCSCASSTANQYGLHYYFGNYSSNTQVTTDKNSLKEDENNMYAGNLNTFFWLASPSFNDRNSVCCVDSNNLRLTYSNYSTARGICPVVQLKNSFSPELSN